MKYKRTTNHYLDFCVKKKTGFLFFVVQFFYTVQQNGIILLPLLKGFIWGGKFLWLDYK